MRNTKGITLIALVITIIVLLILAGISISMLSGDNSILNRATEAKNNTVLSQEDEQRKLAQMSASLNLNGTESSEGIKIPAGFAVSEKEGENTVENGLVITDSEGNEYVWIEVPRTVTENATTDDEIYIALKNYISIGGNSSIYNNECGLSEDEYNSLKSKMLNSIKNNGGFWIGRYETGIDGSDKNIGLARQSHTDITESSPKAVSKKDCIPYNWVTLSEAQMLASKVSTSAECTSSVMFEMQWWLMIKYLKNKGIESDLLSKDSSSWGNFNLEYNLNQTKPHGYYGVLSMSDWSLTWNSIPSGYVHTANANECIALSTGASERNKLKNMYDLAGNFSEILLAKSDYSQSGKSFPTISMGGIFIVNTGALQSAISGPMASSHCLDTFRITIF